MTTRPAKFLAGGRCLLSQVRLVGIGDDVDIVHVGLVVSRWKGCALKRGGCTALHPTTSEWDP